MINLEGHLRNSGPLHGKSKMRAYEGPPNHTKLRFGSAVQNGKRFASPLAAAREASNAYYFDQTDYHSCRTICG